MSKILLRKIVPDVPHAMFLFVTLMVAIVIVLLVGFIFYEAAPTFQREGLSFLLSSEWDYEDHEYGILNFIVGTIVTTGVTMLMAFPLSILTAIFLAEYAPDWLSRIMRLMIELLIGIPSVVYGIFGLYVLGGFYRDYLDPFISNTFGFIPIFYDYTPNVSMSVLLASTILTVMILPTITTLSEESIRSVPKTYIEASYALGATKMDTIIKVVLPVALSGILTGVVLGTMRAMGETMAIVMLLGNVERVPRSILDQGYTMTSKILNDIGYYIIIDEARSALFGMAAILFLVEVLFVFAIRIIRGRFNVVK